MPSPPSPLQSLSPPTIKQVVIEVRVSVGRSVVVSAAAVAVFLLLLGFMFSFLSNFLTLVQRTYLVYTHKQL